VAKYDKSCDKIFVAQMKAILYGDPSAYMTKQRCEEFFDNDDNFDLGETYIEETLIWIAEKMGVPDARIADAFGSQTHKEIIVEGKGGLVDKDRGTRLPFDGAKPALKRQKRISLRYLLHVRSENHMVFTGFRVAVEVFRAKIGSQHAVWRNSAEVEALFRLKLGDVSDTCNKCDRMLSVQKNLMS